MHLLLKPYTNRRIAACVIDYTIIITVNVLYIINFGEYDNSESTYHVNGLMALPTLLYWVFMTAGLETLFGATIGNSLMGLKPVPLKNQHNKIHLGQALLRHIFDFADMSFFGLVGILTIKNSQYHQRVGDIIAGTIVIPATQPLQN